MALLQESADHGRGEFFAAYGAKDEISFIPTTLDAKERTVDVVWYGGATVPRMNYDTGEPYMLSLDMNGCRMGRLNAGAAVFDNHINGADFRSAMANKNGTEAQLGVVLKAWADGPKGMATLKFDDDGDDGPATKLWNKISGGIVKNLSFGTWIYSMQQVNNTDGSPARAQHTSGEWGNVFSATDWEPFEISPVTVPADFTTTFLSAEGAGGERRAISPKEKEQPVAETTQAGNEARTEVVNLDAVRAEAIKAEQDRVKEIRRRGVKFASILGEDFISNFAGTPDEFSVKALDIVAQKGIQATNGVKHETHTEMASVTRDGRDTMRECMEAALLVRSDPKTYASVVEKGREFVGLSLLEMGRECLTAVGVKTRGIGKMELADMLLRPRIRKVRNGFADEHFQVESFDGGSESTSDFPAILANVANKTLRQSYEAYPQTFKPFCRQVTAADFKPINRVQLSDAPSLQKLNEKGEYHRANLTDMNSNYSLATYGEIVALTRKTIINDDTQAFTRIPAVLGVAAARLQSDVVWGIITANGLMPLDGVALFAAGHNNLYTGAGSALGLTGLTAGRKGLRLQTAPQGTPLNLTPRYIAVPAALETTALQLIYPMQLAATAVTGVVPEWVMSLVPIVEPRLDAASSSAWYLIADPTQIDTLEYCFLEGQEGVYFETRQGFEVDGIEMKARMDFAAAPIDFRGVQENAGV